MPLDDAGRDGDKLYAVGLVAHRTMLDLAADSRRFYPEEPWTALERMRDYLDHVFAMRASKELGG